MIKHFVKDYKTIAATDNLVGLITSSYLDYSHNLGLNEHH